MPYGTVREHGLYFVAFSADPVCFDEMLSRMFAVGNDGPPDRLTDFSQPVSAGYYFARSMNALTNLTAGT